MATLERAVEIAAIVHAGTRDKGGREPYLLHPLRLMMKMRSETARIVAVLHDVVEDSADNPPERRWTLERLSTEEGFSAEVIEALDGVTDRKAAGESYDDFVRRAARNPISKEVKIADLEDNMNILRLAEITPKSLERLARYHRSWLMLTDSARVRE